MKRTAQARTSIPRIIVRVPTVVLCLCALSSCGGGGESAGPGPGPGPGPTVPAAVETITLTPTAMALVLQQERTMTATLRDKNGTTLTGRSVTWTTSNGNIATVSEGAVSAVAIGSATITATSEGKTGTADVTVISVPIVAFASVVAGGAHTCALTSNGEAYCWGRGESGQLGVAPPTTTCSLDTPPPTSCSLRPLPVSGGRTFIALTAGGAHTCGLTGDGSAYCWGSNASGQLGDNSVALREQPTAVATALKFSKIDAGTQHTCALTNDGTAYCWGLNDRGQIGDGSVVSRPVPVEVGGNLKFQLITAGGFSRGHTCAVTANGEAYCWGDNERGQLGSGSADLALHPFPSAVSTPVRFTAVTAGLGRHTCGRTIAGGAYCWGENSFGALGNGGTSDIPSPIAVSGGFAFTQLIAGGFIGHTCGLVTDGRAFCWGENEVGAVGDGSTADRLTPFQIASTLSWTNIDAGFRHTCARAGTGAVYCWGSGRAGQLGTNSPDQSSSPVKVVGQQ